MHDVLVDGECITCHPVEHRLVDGICVTCSPAEMSGRSTASFNPAEPRDPDGKWTGGPAGAVKDVLKLAERIDLKPGETFGGSAQAADSNGDLEAVLARVDGPDGMRIRFGAVHPDDARQWRAANKGGTVVLDEHGVQQLRKVLADAPPAGKKAVAKFYADSRKAEDADLPHSEWPDPEEHLDGGVIHADWGDLHWSLTREPGGKELPGGLDGSEWSLNLAPVQHGSDPGRAESYSVTKAGEVKLLDQALAGLTSS